MAEEKTFPMTLEGKKKLEDELEEYRLKRRPEVIKRIKIARSYGDLSENSEYESAKDEQAMVESGCQGIVIEAYGLGGMNYIRRNMVAAIGKLIRRGIPIIATSQCLYERSDLTKYEVGREALLEGAISARDMTSESAITKLMWGLGQNWDVHQISDFFNTDVAGEVTIEKDDNLQID